MIDLLRKKKALVSYHDPFIDSIAYEDWKLESIPDLMAGVQAADCVVIVTDHSGYDYDDILENAKLIMDTRNALGAAGRESAKVARV